MNEKMKKNSKLRIQDLKFWKTVFLIFLVLSVIILGKTYAKIYIDISSPGLRKLPIAIQEFSGPHGKEIAEIIKDDLEFTGFFSYIDSIAYIENPAKPFNPANWKPLGVDAVLKGAVIEGKEISARASLYDVLEGETVMQKGYTTSSEFIRLLAHSIANDVYYLLTGEKGVFKTKLIFAGEDNHGKGIYQTDWDGARMHRLTSGGNAIMSLRWSRDGSKIVYSAERNREWGIYLLDLKKRIEHRIFSSKGINIAGDFTHNGEQIIISSSKEGNPELYKIDIRDGKIIKLTSSHGIDVSPSVSPDGGQIAFVSDRGGTPQIYLMKIDGSGIRRLTFEGSYNTSPSWSPRGDKIAFSGRSGSNQIFLINPDGTGLTQLTSHGNNEEPSFSPDGRYIAFTSDRDGKKAVYIMRANGEAQKKISPPNMKAYCPRWSPY